jgi:TPP-dependent indolepyruvate ferredoxin oxidoreductase alpha subunit
LSLNPSSASETGNNDQHLTVFRAADLIGDRVHIQTSGNEQQSASRENVMKITFRHEDPKKNNKHRKITVSRGRGRICKFCPSRSQNTAVKKMIKKGLHYMDVGCHCENGTDQTITGLPPLPSAPLNVVVE